MASNLQYNNNPYMLFDQSQWSNPYSNFNNQPIPWPSQVMNQWPTDAMGNPIGGGPPPGMTLNSQPAAPPPQPPPQQQNLGLDSRFASPRQTPDNPLGLVAGPGSVPAAWLPWNKTPQQSPQAAQPAPAAAPSNAMTRAQYLNLLGNPGAPAVVGANVPQTGQARNDPGVLQQFLANWKPAQSGSNSGFQQSFASALKGLGYG
jgi:hypothetical protein